MMNDLFSKRENFKIVRLAEDDAKRVTDHVVSFKNLVIENEPAYPNIRKWLENKVFPGLKSSERVAFVGYEGETPVVSAVVKRGGHSKFCHLRIGENFQNLRLGETFFALMALEVRSFAREIYFTLPESLWVNKRPFFESFGFERVVKFETQYRPSDTELKCSAPFKAVWKAVVQKLPKLKEYFSIPGYSMNNRLVMSIKPDYAGNIMNGSKRVEIRRKFDKKWTGHTISIYASAPTKALVGEARINNVLNGHPKRIWEEFGSLIGCSKEDFDKYSTGTEEIFAIVLDNMKPFRASVPLTQLSGLLNKDLTPPQSYLTLQNNKSWAEAVSVAVLLHGSFTSESPITFINGK